MFALRRAKLEISSIPLSEVDLSFQCHCLPTQQPPFHFETHYHKCEDFYWLVSFFITGSKSYHSKFAILISKSDLKIHSCINLISFGNTTSLWLYP